MTPEQIIARYDQLLAEWCDAEESPRRTALDHELARLVCDMDAIPGRDDERRRNWEALVLARG